MMRRTSIALSTVVTAWAAAVFSADALKPAQPVKAGDQPTPLHRAALQDGLEAVELLLDHGADPNALDDRHQTPLHLAISGDADIRIVKRLVNAGTGSTFQTRMA